MSVLESHTFLETPAGRLTLNDGWESHLAEQILDKSRQTHIEEMVPDDPGEKFSSLGKIEQWRDLQFAEKDPIIRWFGTAANELAGIAWIENAHRRPYHGARIFGVRVYEGFEGASVATSLTKAVHAAFDQQQPGSMSQFTMLTRNNKAFLVGKSVGYSLDTTALYTQTYIRNRKY